MRCEDAREILPEYLAGTLDDHTRTEIDKHLKTCAACSAELKEISSDVTLNIPKASQADEKRIIRKTKVKFNLAIVRTVAVIAGILLLISAVPTFLWGIQSVFGQSKASRALMDVVQFSQPDKVNMWGNSAAQGFSFTMPLKIGARPVIGRNYGVQLEFTAQMSVITGKVTVPTFIGASFVHPDLFKDANLGRDRDVSTQSQILGKNADTTVATVDYSLNKVIGLSDVENLLGKYDAEVCWMAVEAGIEDLEPRNMTFKNQQVLQWGIPGKLSRPGKFDFAVLKNGSGKEFEKSVIEELQWLDKYKNVLKPNASLLKINGIDNSVKGQPRYIINNGIKIYGLRITGPSSELLKLTRDLDIRTMSVIDMDFWNW
jgi:hypothetical protein